MYKRSLFICESVDRSWILNKPFSTILCRHIYSPRHPWIFRAFFANIYTYATYLHLVGFPLPMTLLSRTISAFGLCLPLFRFSRIQFCAAYSTLTYSTSLFRSNTTVLDRGRLQLKHLLNDLGSNRTVLGWYKLTNELRDHENCAKLIYIRDPVNEAMEFLDKTSIIYIFGNSELSR